MYWYSVLYDQVTEVQYCSNSLNWSCVQPRPAPHYFIISHNCTNWSNIANILRYVYERTHMWSDTTSCTRNCSCVQGPQWRRTGGGTVRRQHHLRYPMQHRILPYNAILYNTAPYHTIPWHDVPHHSAVLIPSCLGVLAVQYCFVHLTYGAVYELIKLVSLISSWINVVTLSWRGVLYGMAWHGMVWLVWYGMVWYGIVW